jgi:hypothetical protein
LSKEDVIYAAGLIDGEGTITLSRKSAKETYRHPVVAVPSCTPILVEAMKSLFGGFICNKKSKPEHTPSQAWHVSYNAAISCLEQIVPFLKEPEKIRRAKLILEEYKQLTPRNGRYTVVQREAKLNFEKRFFESPIKPNRDASRLKL